MPLSRMRNLETNVIKIYEMSVFEQTWNECVGGMDRELIKKEKCSMESGRSSNETFPF